MGGQVPELCALHALAEALENGELPEDYKRAIVLLNIAALYVQVPRQSRCMTIRKEGHFPARITKVHEDWITRAQMMDTDLDSAEPDPHLLGRHYVGDEVYVDISAMCVSCKKKYVYICNAERCAYVHALPQKRRRNFEVADLARMWDSFPEDVRTDLSHDVLGVSIMSLLEEFVENEGDENATPLDIQAFRLADQRGLTWTGEYLATVIETMTEGVLDIESLAETKYTPARSMHDFAGLIIVRMIDRILKTYDARQRDLALAWLTEEDDKARVAQEAQKARKARKASRKRQARIIFEKFCLKAPVTKLGMATFQRFLDDTVLDAATPESLWAAWKAREEEETKKRFTRPQCTLNFLSCFKDV